MTDDGAEYHVNYRGPSYMPDVWYLCGAFDNLAEARAFFSARIAADTAAITAPGSEWRLVGVRDGEVVKVIEHVRRPGPIPVRERA
ncbi:MAG TPA: hypothetical protein VD995_06475 [Azospirillum sp.]|nr:hypothetical protein [Azospirillum sp.]